MIAILAFIAFLSAHSSFPTPELLDRQELFCLAQAVHWEARGEPPLGQAAVAHVVLNRVRSSRFPDTVCEVVHQPRQFTDLPLNYSPQGPSWTAAVEVAGLSYIGFVEDPTNGALWFYAQDKVTPWWAEFKIATARIGGHTFMVRKGEQDEDHSTEVQAATW